MKYIKNRYNVILESKQLSKREESLIELLSRYSQKMNSSSSYDDVRDYLYRIVRDYNLSNSLTPTLIKMAYSLYNKGSSNTSIFKYIDKLIKYKNLLKNNNYDILKRESEVLSSEGGNIEFNHKVVYIHPNNLKLINDIDNYSIGDNYEDYYINVMNSLELYSNLFEELNDDLEKLIIKSENVKFTKKFISNKYKHLVNEETYKLFGKLSEYINSHEEVQNVLTKKMISFKTPTELNDTITNLIYRLANDIKKLAESNGAEVVFDDKNNIVIYCPTFESIQKIGTSNWCIVREKTYWDKYVQFGHKQYIVINKGLGITNPLYMIGVTIGVNETYSKYDKNRYITEAFDQEDEDIFNSGVDDGDDILEFDELDNYDIIANNCLPNSINDLASEVSDVKSLIKFQKLNLNSGEYKVYTELRKFVDREGLYSYGIGDDNIKSIYQYIDSYEDTFRIKNYGYYESYTIGKPLDDIDLVEEIIDSICSYDTKQNFRDTLSDKDNYLMEESEKTLWVERVKKNIINSVSGGKPFEYSGNTVYVYVMDKYMVEHISFPEARYSILSIDVQIPY